MSARACKVRDPFEFSLGGIRTVSSFAFVPAIDDNALNRAWDRRLANGPVESPDLVREIEDFLVRYFAPGCREAA